MGLSHDLISQFVKITNDSSKTAKETTVYGTVVDVDGVKYVQLDGQNESSLLKISTNNTTSDVITGDRVIVMVKNHSAIITGNLTSRSARFEDERIVHMGDVHARFNSLETKTATITEELTATKVTVTDHLAANEASFNELKAKDAEITGTLSAHEGRIETLESDHIDTDTLDARYATIENLKATNEEVYSLKGTYATFVDTTTERLNAAEGNIVELTSGKADITDLTAATGRIAILESDVGEIDTLIFGSASGNTIQTSFANSVIAQLGDAQIKSAMIKDVSADKIKGNIILTDNLNVLSEDGKIIISDETIQIKDDSEVRVQIGKDAEGDYSINVWDADGNLMFSKGGITDSAIKQAIIRNDMVSDTANIAAHKLDIDSLFEEINGSTNTIKSTQIKVDEEGQTLDVAFKTLTTDVDDLQNSVSSQGTQITAIQGQITSKVWQQDIDTVTDTVGEQYAYLDNQINSMSGQLSDQANSVRTLATAIDQNTTSITSMSTQYSELDQKIDGISATVANHTTEISNKADNSTITTVNNKVTSLEANLSGFKTTVEQSITDATKYTLKKSTVDLSGDEYDESLYYPVVGNGIPDEGYKTFQVNVQLNSYSKPSWSTHDAGFTCNLSARMKAFGWGTAVNNLGWIDDYSFQHCNAMPVYIQQMTNASVPVLYLRGGGRYYVYTDYKCTWTPYTSDYTVAQQTMSPTATPSNFWGLVNNWTDHNDLVTAKSSITQLSDRITANVTETTKLGTRMSTVEQTADGLTTRLNTTDTNVSNAAKTATNYLNYSSSGLVVGDMTADTLGKNVRISSSTVDIREGTTTLASFGANTIYLGKNSETAVINLCNGSATMRSVDDSDFKIYTDKRLVMSAYSSALLDCWRDSTHMTRISLQSADPDKTYMWGGISCSVYQDTVKNTFDISNNTTEFKIIKGTTESLLSMDETKLKIQANNVQVNCTNGLYVGYDGDYKPAITLGYNSLQSKSIRWYWSDNALHDAFSNGNGQITYVGPGDIEETTTTMVRGQYVRLYAHSGGAVYLGYSGSTAVTSDRNLKSDIVDIDDKYIDFFDRLRPITYKYDAPGNKGHRDHVGFVAQEVEEALIASGLTTEQFAGLIIENDVTLNSNYDSNLSDEENAINETHYDKLYSLRYEEFISLLVKKVQSLQEQINQIRGI